MQYNLAFSLLVTVSSAALDSRTPPELFAEHAYKPLSLYKTLPIRIKDFPWSLLMTISFLLFTGFPSLYHVTVGSGYPNGGAQESSTNDRMLVFSGVGLSLKYSSRS